MKFTYTKSEKLCPSVELYALSTIILSSSSFSESIGTKSHMEVQDQFTLQDAQRVLDISTSKNSSPLFFHFPNRPETFTTSFLFGEVAFPKMLPLCPFGEKAPASLGNAAAPAAKNMRASVASFGNSDCLVW